MRSAPTLSVNALMVYLRRDELVTLAINAQSGQRKYRPEPPWLASSSRELIMEGLQTTALESSFAADEQFHMVANSLARLLETARRELERDRDAAKASLATASHILQN